MESGYRRCLELWESPSTPLGPDDMDLLIRLGLLPMDAPFSGVVRNLVGAVFSQRGMASADAVVGPACEYARRLPPGGEPQHPVNGIVWAALRAKRELTTEACAGVEEFLDLVLRVPSAVVLGRSTSGGNISVTLATLQLAELHREDAKLPRSSRFVEARAARGDWAVVARAWDQLLFAGYIRVKPVLGYVEHVVSFPGPDRLRVGWGEGTADLAREDLAREAAEMPARRRPGYDILQEKRPREVAVLHLLATVGTLELLYPREVHSFYRRNEVPRTWISLMRSLSDGDALRKIRDEKMLTYAVNHCVAGFPEFRHGVRGILEMLHADAARRGFAPPTRESLVALLGGVLDRGLDLVYGVARPPSPARPAGSGA
jgi:hypothetical protein